MSLQNVASKSKELTALEPIINLIDSLLGGTEKMREAGETFLPMFKSEVQKDYKKRLSAATLMPAYRETIEDMAGRVFGKKITKENINKDITQYADDFSGNGDDIIRFFEKVFYSAMAYGRSFVVTDYTGDGTAMTIQEQKQRGDRPIAFRVQLPDVLDIRYGNIDGANKITLFKYQQVVEEVVDRFTTIEVKEVVLYEAGVVTFYRQNVKNEWYEHHAYLLTIDNEIIDYVPVEELKLARIPPLLDVAWLNVKHWQSQSTQDHLVNTARVPILAAINAGFAKQKETNPDFEIYVNGLIDLPKEADMKYVELQGESIRVGLESIKEIERQMEFAGAKVLTRTVIAFTETQAGEEAKERISELMFYAMMLDGYIVNVLKMYGAWIGVSDGDEGFLTISDNVDDKIKSDASITDLNICYNNRILSAETVFNILKIRNLIPEDLLWEDEKARIAAESLTLFDSLGGDDEHDD